MSDDQKQKEPWKKRRMIGGQWTDPDAVTSKAVVTKTISVKLTEAELAEFDAQIDALGIKRNRALRIMARQVSGFLEEDAGAVAHLADISRQLRGIAVNVNQIAKAANRTTDPDFIAFMEERQRLGKELSRVQSYLQALFDIDKRRSDGAERLKKAAQT
ncbi:DNA mobilization endonuclease VirD1/MobC family subunit [Falsirhodobacter sp. 1013]|uniref:DNA mobilization endonuclease VirD1/MobC family subunit n=1 Tax=Falsirhodobacter sp. 1013 TaxID=3417566 RepID=UPI003EBA3B24